MQLSDLDDVLELEQASFPSPWSRDLYIHELVRNPYSRYRVVVPMGAKEQGEGDEDRPSILAQCGWMLAGDEAHILTIAVQPSWRGRGIGAWLLLRMCQEARGAGARTVSLEVRPSNRAALALYQGLGFRQVGRRRRYYPDKEDALILELANIHTEGVWGPLRARLTELDARMQAGVTI